MKFHSSVKYFVSSMISSSKMASSLLFDMVFARLGNCLLQSLKILRAVLSFDTNLLAASV